MIGREKASAPVYCFSLLRLERKRWVTNQSINLFTSIRGVGLPRSSELAEAHA